MDPPFERVEEFIVVHAIEDSSELFDDRRNLYMRRADFSMERGHREATTFLIGLGARGATTPLASPLFLCLYIIFRYTLLSTSPVYTERYI